MRKRSKYKPRPIFHDTMAYVMSGFKKFSDVDFAVHIRIKNHDAMDTIRKGDATRNEIDVLISAFNMCEAYTMLKPEFGRDWHEEIGAGLNALHAVGKRGVASGRFILTAKELTAMNLVMEIHDAQLDQTTVQEMEQAMDIIKREHRAKRMRPIVQKEKV
jgi:hypothetical protein